MWSNLSGFVVEGRAGGGGGGGGGGVGAGGGLVAV